MRPTTTTLSSLSTTKLRKHEFDSIRYKVSDSSQVETLDEGDDEEGDESLESTTGNPTVDPKFLELSRQAFFHLNQGEQYIKPVVQTDEDRRLTWLAEHQRRKEERKGL